MTGVPRSFCESAPLATWDTLYGILKEKDEQGMVEFRVGNYHDYCYRMTDVGHTCYWQGEQYEIPSYRRTR